jgi:FkbM family methyltransferase
MLPAPPPRLSVAPDREPRKWLEPPSFAALPAAVQTRIATTLACRDSDSIPKVRDAGRIFELDGERVQVMHEGTLVQADGYYGEWMARLIAGLRGHHEPQEETIFHALVGFARPGTLFVELGAYWAFYTNWYLGAVPGARAVCVEPAAANLEIGRRNLARNGRTALIIQAAVGETYRPAAEPAAGRIDAVERLDMATLLDRIGHEPIEVIHLDVQGAETGFLRSMRRCQVAGALRFVVLSTHHESFTGSPTTHDDCLEELRTLGAAVLVEHSVAESFSGDGLIVASFDLRDRSCRLPPISRAAPELSGLMWESAGMRSAPAAGPTTWLQRQALKLRRSWRKRLGQFGLQKRAA